LSGNCSVKIDEKLKTRISVSWIEDLMENLWVYDSEKVVRVYGFIRCKCCCCDGMRKMEI
jgi:hypothetical protein